MQAVNTNGEYLAKVQVFRWIISGIILIIMAALFAFLFFNTLSAGGSESLESNKFRKLWPILPIIAPLILGYGFYFLYFGIRPEHAKISAQGISTRSWQLSWPEILDTEINNGRIYLWVTPEAAQRVKPANRWHSGRPAGGFGLLAKRNTVGLQASLVKQKYVFEIISSHLKTRTENIHQQ